MNVSTLTVDALAQHCAEDTQKFYRQQSSDSQFCFELLRRALAEQQADAFARVYQIYEAQVLNWVYHHPRFPQTNESTEYFASFAMSRFYFALRGDKFGRFAMLPQVLAYLKMCTHTAILHYLRSQPAAPLADLEEAHVVDSHQPVDADLSIAELWSHICTLLPDQIDQLLARCVFVQDLKPAEIADRYPQHWRKSREVSVALQRIRRNLRHDPELRRWAGLM
jgi:hypothetical protein